MKTTFTLLIASLLLFGNYRIVIKYKSGKVMSVGKCSYKTKSDADDDAEYNRGHFTQYDFAVQECK